LVLTVAEDSRKRSLGAKVRWEMSEKVLKDGASVDP